MQPEPLPAMDPEAAFVKAFLTSEKRARFIQHLADPKRRKEILTKLDGDLPTMPGFATEVPGHLDFPDELEKLLTAKGAGATCHVIADGLKIDGKELPLRDALRAICMHERGAILCCIPERLAYYKPASPAFGIILEKPPL